MTTSLNYIWTFVFINSLLYVLFNVGDLLAVYYNKHTNGESADLVLNKRRAGRKYSFCIANVFAALIVILNGWQFWVAMCGVALARAIGNMEGVDIWKHLSTKKDVQDKEHERLLKEIERLNKHHNDFLKMLTPGVDSKNER
jgi:hypothetical protein